jgi:hypothetical protein
VDRLCRETEQPWRDVPSITMTTIWIVGLGGLLVLCFGLLLGSTWTIQALDRQYRRLAIEWRELNAARVSIQEDSMRCPWCGMPDLLSTDQKFMRYQQGQRGNTR